MRRALKSDGLITFAPFEFIKLLYLHLYLEFAALDTCSVFLERFDVIKPGNLIDLLYNATAHDLTCRLIIRRNSQML